MDLFKLFEEDRSLSDDEGIAAFELLAPLLRAAPGDPDCIRAATHVVGLLDVTGPVAQVLDWWLSVMSAADAIGPAYNLSSNALAEVAPAMEAVRDLSTGAVSSGRWAIAARLYDREVRSLKERLDPVVWKPRIQIANETALRSDLNELASGVFAALRAGAQCPEIVIDESEIESLMVGRDITRNSPIWGQTKRRELPYVKWIADMAKLNGIVAPWLSRAEPPVVSTVPEPLATLFGAIANLVFEPILAEPGPWGDPELEAWFDRVPERYVRGLGDLADRLDSVSKMRLLALVDEWSVVTGRSVGPLRRLEARKAKLESALDAAAERSIDVSESRAALDAHDLERAEALHHEALNRSRIERRVADLQRELEGLIDRAAGDLDGERRDIFLSLAEHAEDAVAQLDPSEAQRSIQKMNKLLAEGSFEEDVAKLDAIRAEASRADPDSDLVDAIDDALEAAYASGELPAELIDELRAELDDVVDELQSEIEHDLSQISSLELERADDIDTNLAVEIDDRKSEASKLREDGEYSVALVVVRSLLGQLMKLGVTRWKSSESEASLVDHIIAYCNQHHTFQDHDIRRFHVAIKTKPFVVLAGLTGSGKSTLARVYAAALGATEANGRYRRIAVRPDWIDQSEVLGYLNPRTGVFEPGWLAAVAVDCAERPDELFFVLLDEMNLAPVEHYLAEYLSVLEEHRSGSAESVFRLYSSASKPGNAGTWPPELGFPNNLIVIGTVNVDESTRALSPRVLDRANVLQLSMEITNEHHHPIRNEVMERTVRFSDWSKITTNEPSDAHHDFLVEIADILQRVGIGVGQRSHIELERFIANSRGVLTDEDALDLGILQRIIPKIRGFRFEIKESLALLREEFERTGCSRSQQVVEFWLDDRRSDDRFIDGTDPKIGLALR
ncbi:MAG: AAA family ATPase [Microthrixaceae bacterium]